VGSGATSVVSRREAVECKGTRVQEAAADDAASETCSGMPAGCAASSWRWARWRRQRGSNRAAMS
jgi:hypothetical protein